MKIKVKNHPLISKYVQCPRESQSFVSRSHSHRGFLRSDKPIGTALVKLDKLESQSEIREIVEVSVI